MKTNMAETPLATYQGLGEVAYLNPKEREVMELMRGFKIPPMTREEIARRPGWKEASVCGRANSLVMKGMLEEIEGGMTASGRPAKLLRLPVAQQELLFK